MNEIVKALFDYKQFSIPVETKKRFLFEELSSLTNFHNSNCLPYKKILNGLGYANSWKSFTQYQEIPYIPVGLFKTLKLSSITDDKIIRVLTSSGTTGASVSQVFIDRETAILQTKALAAIITSFIGNKRLPMILVDCKSMVQNKESFSARTAGLLGLSNFGRDHLFLLDDQMEVDIDGLRLFVEKHQGEKILIFGFTFLVWKYFYQFFRENQHYGSILNGSTLIHGGGWKKLIDLSVSNETFKHSIKNELGVSNVYDYYGMVEQIGSIFMECEYGYMHCPNFADIIIRSKKDFSILPPGQEGLIQTISVLPRSYPGHSILTEDIGIQEGFDGCRCGRLGSYFKITGRIPKSDIRGCSDTYTEYGNDQIV